MMRLAISGTGRMGAAVEASASARGHAIVRRFHRSDPLARGEQLRGVDLVIDFSHADAIERVLEVCSEERVALVTGTTGWDTGMLEALPTSHWAVLHAPNFSVGVAMLRHALGAVLPLVRTLPGFDVAIHEVHHTGKADRPSGTALALARQVLDALPAKASIAPENRPPEAHELAVTASRTDGVFGTHDITIEGPSDRMLLRHDARDRSGFAQGAVLSAEWLTGRRGRYTFEHVLGMVPAIATPST